MKVVAGYRKETEIDGDSTPFVLLMTEEERLSLISNLRRMAPVKDAGKFRGYMVYPSEAMTPEQAQDYVQQLNEKYNGIRH